MYLISVQSYLLNTGVILAVFFEYGKLFNFMDLFSYQHRLCLKISTVPHINSETNPPVPIINIVCKYLRQFLGTSFGFVALPIYATLSRGEGPDLFLQSEHARIFSSNCLDFNNLCEILSQNLRKLGKQSWQLLVFWQFF